MKIEQKLSQDWSSEKSRPKALSDFNTVKESKLASRKGKYNDGSDYDFHCLLGHFYEELHEMQDELHSNKEALLNELADMSNCLDVMAWMVMSDLRRESN